MTAEEFWKLIDERLDNSGLSLKDMSDGTGIGYQTISMQRIRGSLPKLEQLIQMATFFDITLDELVLSSDSLSKRALRIAQASDKAREEVLYCIEKLLDLRE